MIGAHLAGIDHSYKKVNKTLAKCLICGEYSECQILKYEESTHILYIKIKTLAEQFIFDWRQCNHRAVLYDKEDVARYKREQVETGILGVPYYHDMKLQMVEMPKKVPVIQIVLVLLVGLLFGLLVAFVLDKLGIPWVP